jgi:hypothetical protein
MNEQSLNNYFKKVSSEGRFVQEDVCIGEHFIVWTFFRGGRFVSMDVL